MWQPEHLAVYGPTGTGKTHFQTTILDQRARQRGSHIVLIATKPADSAIRSLGWPIIEKWPPNYNQTQVIFWAKNRTLDSQGMRRQRAAILTVLQRLWEPESNRIVVFDEIAYLDQELKMRPILTRYYREARALGITIVASTQRPAGVTRYMHSESSWGVYFAPQDEDDAERVAQVAGNKRYFRDVLLSLNREKYEFLMVRNLTREFYISSLPRRA